MRCSGEAMDRIPSPRELCGWKALYIAALFENDKPKIAGRIAEAHSAIQARRRELTLSPNDVRERHALDNALFSLEALRTCLSILPTEDATSFQLQMAG
ncbi:MAG TPA: hypothetical protein VK763_05530 [Terriglobales bacterium]|jgi:hypothetical protein|nr:hypothetical protein [Terriglobales bacterium]